jgi:hypothetical protein
MSFRPHRRTLRFFLVLSIACVACLTGPASAFPLPESPVPVVEYYNIDLKHYFLTADPGEIAKIDTGWAGRWVRTGWSFLAYPAASNLPCPQPMGCGKPVSRFYGTPGLGPNSHFYTADPAEAASLEQPGSGWSLEQIAFQIDVPGPDGRCAAGLVPVYRLYNDRWMYNDSNHRYVTDAGERAKMVALGWSDEGARFCAYGASQMPIKSYSIGFTPTTRVMPSADCENEAENRGACVAVNNLRVPATLYPATQPDLMPEAFFDRTGMASSKVHVVPSIPLSDSPLFDFVQEGGSTIGVHVDTDGRGPGALSSVNPLYQFHTTVDPGTFDDRFFPFGTYESDTQLDLHFTLNVKTIETRSTGSAAYGHPTLEFIDQRSGHHLYFTVVTYGTIGLSSDYLAPDLDTGKAIVGTTFRADSPYITNLGLTTLPTPSGFVSPNFWGWGGYFEYRMDRDQFQRVLDSARTIDPALSDSPADYLLDNFHFNNEVYGDGEIGVNLANYTLELLRR